MDPINATLLVLLFSILTFIIYQAWKINQFWKERGIPYIKPWLFLGNSAPIAFMKMSVGERHEDICNSFPNEPIVGFYDFMKPTLLIKDVNMIEKILIKDFVHFTDHGFLVDEERNPLDSNLFTMTGKRWKAMRNKVTPIFTSGKLRNMFDCLTDSGNEMITQLKDTKEVEMKEIFGRFAMDVIGSCAFGIEGKNLSEPDNEFRRMGKRTFDMEAKQFIMFIIATNFPSLNKTLNISFNKKDVLNYFAEIIRNTIKYRRENGYQRNDFLQLMMQLQDKGFVEIHTKDPDDDYLNIESSFSTEKFELTDEQITGQAFTFLSAGFEGTALTMMYTLYELSKNQEIQEKVREEVRREVNKFEGSITYDSVKDMVYLEQCVKESMRKYPPAQMLFRVCTKEYILPNGVKIEPGQPLIIPLKCLHYDPSHYPDPHKFQPERFDKENILHSCAFLPFGNGPRMCLAMRFAMLQMKYCLAKLFFNYNFQINAKTKEPLTVSVRNFFTSPNEQIIFTVTKLDA